MEGLRAITTRFPDRELEIRRRCSRDPRFGAVCGDYEEAAAALQRWRQAVSAEDRRVREYEELLAELEAEILAGLAGPGTAARPLRQRKA